MGISGKRDLAVKVNYCKLSKKLDRRSTSHRGGGNAKEIIFSE